MSIFVSTIRCEQLFSLTKNINQGRVLLMKTWRNACEQRKKLALKDYFSP